MLPRDAVYIYDWSPGIKLSYGDFLRAQRPEDSLRYGIDNLSRQLVATDQQLSGRGIAVLSADPERGFILLSQQTGVAAKTGQESGFPPQRMDAASPNPGNDAGSPASFPSFHWGYSEALMSQGQMNIPLDELMRLGKPPVQAWACEQFVRGRDEFRRQMYKEALQTASHAIGGLGSNQGNPAEFRAHFLVGIIRLGSYRNNSPELVKPQLARQAFLEAARHAEPGHAAEAGLALICAGRSAFVGGDIDEAIAHTRKGLSLAPNHAEGMYQLARALFLKGSRDEAAERLADAILLDIEHALHACGDPDLTVPAEFLNKAFRQALERHEARYRQVAERYRRALRTLRDFSFTEVPLEVLQPRGLAAIQEIPQAAETLAATKTLFGCGAATDHYLGGFRLFPACFEEFKAHCIRELRARILQPPRREDYLPVGAEALLQEGHGSSRAGLASGFISGLAVFLFESAKVAQPIYRGILESTSELFLIPLLAAAGIAAVVTVAEDLYREYVRARHKSAQTAFEAACYIYGNLRKSLESEIEDIQRMSMPREFAQPSFPNAAGSGRSSAAPETQKRVSAWAKL